MKGMADALGDLGEVIQGRTLVLGILRGLSPKCNHMKALLKRSRPFPTFSEVRNDLILEELIMAPPLSQPPTALLATQKKAAAPGASQELPAGGSSSASAPSSFNRPAGGGPGTNNVGSSGTSNRRRRGGNSGNGGKGSTPWPSIYNPWMGSMSMWPGPSGQQQHQVYQQQ